MQPNALPKFDGATKRSHRSHPTWDFAVGSAVVGAIAGWCVVFYLGLRAAAPPPLPPGTVHCGNALLGGWVLMLLGAPIAASVCCALAGALGGLVDYLRNCSMT